MTIDAATNVWLFVGAYALLGLLIGGEYLFRGAARLDAAADGASIWFRLIALPGGIAVWPLFLVRRMSGRKVDAASADDHARALPSRPVITVSNADKRP